MKAAIMLATLYGVITMYSSEKYGGEPLYCDDGTGIVYSDDLAFIALDVREFESGRAKCGDWIQVTIRGVSFWAQALDAGPFKDYYIAEFGRDVPIVGDLPDHMWRFLPAISAQGQMFNESAFNRAAIDCKMGHLR